MAAGLLIVSARVRGETSDKDGISLFLVPADAKGVDRQALKLADSRGAANIGFTDVEVGADALLGEEAAGWDLLEATLDRARAGLAAEMLGASLQAFEVTLDYLKTRVQFGQVIGSFQALQHRAAKMFTDLELTRSCVEAALTAIDNKSPDTAELVSLAKAKAGDTLHLVSNEMVQMHGGNRHDRRPRRRPLPKARPRRRSHLRRPKLPPRPLRAAARVLNATGAPTLHRQGEAGGHTGFHISLLSQAILNAAGHQLDERALAVRSAIFLQA